MRKSADFSNSLKFSSLQHDFVLTQAIGRAVVLHAGGGFDSSELASKADGRVRGLPEPVSRDGSSSGSHRFTMNSDRSSRKNPAAMVRTDQTIYSMGNVILFRLEAQRTTVLGQPIVNVR
ncbi:MAG: hypothetical protein DCF32_11735 [Leptolyngbya sp.]|nr:MAG: hypothetical protein DCF32_11735 [Leptolyngbya sp.]